VSRIDLERVNMVGSVGGGGLRVLGRVEGSGHCPWWWGSEPMGSCVGGLGGVLRAWRWWEEGQWLRLETRGRHRVQLREPWGRPKTLGSSMLKTVVGESGWHGGGSFGGADGIADDFVIGLWEVMAENS
jgi:hypothetical protein